MFSSEVQQKISELYQRLNPVEFKKQNQAWEIYVRKHGLPAAQDAIRAMLIGVLVAAQATGFDAYQEIQRMVEQ